MNENYLLINLNDHGELDGDISILGMYVLCPILGLVIIFASTTCALSLVTISLVSLHNPSAYYGRVNLDF